MENGLNFEHLDENNPYDMDRSLIRLKYTYYRFFIEFLVETFGIENFQAYLKSYINNLQIYKSIFTEYFNEELNEILKVFSIYIESNLLPV